MNVSNKGLMDRLNELNVEDMIWVIYLFIIFMSFYSNSIERKYLQTGDLESKRKYRELIIIIFTILIFVYLHFLKSSFRDLSNLKASDSPKKKKLVYLSFIASLLIAISGFIFLYIALVDDDLDVELAFN